MRLCIPEVHHPKETDIKTQISVHVHLLCRSKTAVWHTVLHIECSVKMNTDYIERRVYNTIVLLSKYIYT